MQNAKIVTCTKDACHYFIATKVTFFRGGVTYKKSIKYKHREVVYGQF